MEPLSSETEGDRINAEIDETNVLQMMQYGVPITARALFDKVCDGFKGIATLRANGIEIVRIRIELIEENIP
jgi:hypothetical protein